MAIDLKERVCRKAPAERRDRDGELMLAAEEVVVELPRFTVDGMPCGFHSDDFTVAGKRHHPIRPHRVEPYRVAVTMQSRAQTIVQRRWMDRDRRQRRDVELAD